MAFIGKTQPAEEELHTMNENGKRRQSWGIERFERETETSERAISNGLNR